MKEVCKFLDTNENKHFCRMSGKEIDENTFIAFCEKATLPPCPTHLYYFQKYKELTSK